MNYLKVLGAVVLSDVLVDSTKNQKPSFAGSPGEQGGATDAGLSLLANLTGSLGGGAGEPGEILKRIQEGGGGSIGNEPLQIQSGGNNGGTNAGIVSNLIFGDEEQGGTGLGSILASAISYHIPGKTESSKPDEQQISQAKLLLKAMFKASNAQNRTDTIDHEKLKLEFANLNEEEFQYIISNAKNTVEENYAVKGAPGTEQQIYLMSLLSINLESKPALQYLKRLAERLTISSEQCEQIHSELGLALLDRTTLGGSPFQGVDAGIAS